MPRGALGAPGVPAPASRSTRWMRRVPRPVSMTERTRRAPKLVASTGLIISEHLACGHLELLDDGPQRERREEGKGADDHDHTDEQRDPDRTGRGEGAEGWRDAPLGGHRAGDREGRDDLGEAADEHRKASRQVVEEGVAAQAGESRAVVAGLAGVGVEDLAEAVRPCVEWAGKTRWRDRGDGREDEDAGAHREHGQHRHLDLERLDLLAQVCLLYT